MQLLIGKNEEGAFIMDSYSAVELQLVVASASAGYNRATAQLKLATGQVLTATFYYYGLDRDLTALDEKPDLGAHRF